MNILLTWLQPQLLLYYFSSQRKVYFFFDQLIKGDFKGMFKCSNVFPQVAAGGAGG